jgi:hypothetical protein
MTRGKGEKWGEEKREKRRESVQVGCRECFIAMMMRRGKNSVNFKLSNEQH